MAQIAIRSACVHQIHWCESQIEKDGLAVTPCLTEDCTFFPDQFHVTHVASGMRLNNNVSLDTAKKLLDALLTAGIDWSKTANEMKELPEHLKHRAAALALLAEEDEAALRGDDDI